ncbi:MAG TPA: hypothetical protein VFI02_10725, partial [Armatimonadota bacterium]|nr:hypothetical protein [Armatimonadota bacterium]
MNSKLNMKRFAVALALTMALSSSAAFAVDKWTTFRQDKDRTGYVESSSGPYRPTPIWVYPVVE